jgi:hypothetical protein
MFAEISNILLESLSLTSNKWLGTNDKFNLYVSHPHFNDQLKSRYLGYGSTDILNKIKRSLIEFHKLDFMNPTEEREYLVYFTESHWGFIVAINPPGYIKCVNPSDKIRKDLPNIIFITALPQKEEMPWTKNPNDIKVIINECKNLFPVIELPL